MNRGLQAGLVLGSLLLAWAGPAEGFGKNKIRHHVFHWRLQRTEHLEVYYYPEESHLVGEVARFAEEAFGRIGTDLGLFETRDPKRLEPLPLVLFLDRRDFEQTTIFPGFIPEGIRGFSEQRRGRMVIPLDGPRRELEELIVHEMTHLLTYRAIGSSSLEPLAASLPLWFMEGLAEHETGTWAAWDEATLRDALVRGQLAPLGRLESFDGLPQPFLGYAIGHAALDFLVEHYGSRFLPRVLGELRHDWGRKSLRRALFRVTHQRLDAIEQEFNGYLLRRYAAILAGPPCTDASTPWPSPDARAAMLAPAASPAGELVAYFTNERGTLEIAISRLRDGARFRSVASTEGRYESLPSDGRPIAWSPDGGTLAFLASLGGRDVLVLWDLARGAERERIDLGLERAYSVAFHPDGQALVVGGTSDGAPDLFAYDRKSRRTTAMTHDGYFDTEPAWSPDGRRLAYSSERAGRWSLVVLEADSGRERVVLDGSGVPLAPAWTADGRRLLCVWDRGGVENIYEVDLASGEARRLTDTLGRTATPFPLPDGRILYAEYGAGRWGLRLLPQGAAPLESVAAKVAPLVLPPPPPAADAALLQASSAPLRLGISDLGWAAGLTEDHRVLLAGSIAFADLFAEKQFVLRLGSDATLEEIVAAYTQLTRRVELTLGTGHRRQHVFFRGERQKQRDEWIEASGVFAFDRQLRLEANLKARRTSNSESFGVYGTEARKALTAGVELVGDYVRYASFGPLEGSRFRVGLEASVPFGGWLEEQTLYADARHYSRLLRRWVLAARVAGALSLGRDPEYFSLGGTETIPGLRLGELTGENFFLGNLELRFPLVDYIGFGPGWSLRQLRGAIFASAGTAFDDLGTLNLWDHGPFRLKDLHASLGLRASVRWSRLDLRLTLAWPTDVSSIADMPELSFTIGTGPIF
jgi:surface antigen Omp85-like protein/WD40 repeat protein